MILTGCPRDTSMYPSTERCEERRDSVDSSSGAIPDDETGALLEDEGFDELPVVTPLGWDMNEVRAVAAPDVAIPPTERAMDLRSWLSVFNYVM